MRQDNNTIKNNNNRDTSDIQELLNKNPEVKIAKEIMEQARKSVKSPVVVEQGNYYRLQNG